jgi:Zn-dependent M28 family amino/carboxypeptidase
MNVASDAPGADDDGSGTAAVIEAARILSHYKFPATLVFAVT